VPEVEVRQRVLAANEEAAAELRNRFARAGTLVLNLISSPGSGKTTLLEATVARLGGRLRLAGVEGDTRHRARCPTDCAGWGSRPSRSSPAEPATSTPARCARPSPRPRSNPATCSSSRTSATSSVPPPTTSARTPRWCSSRSPRATTSRSSIRRSSRAPRCAQSQGRPSAPRHLRPRRRPAPGRRPQPDRQHARHLGAHRRGDRCLVRTDRGAARGEAGRRGVSAPRLRRRLVCRGAVQGVGFRPAVYRLATSLALSGWVRNDAAGATVEVEGDAASVESFLTGLRDALPPLAPARTPSPWRSWRPPATRTSPSSLRLQGPARVPWCRRMRRSAASAGARSTTPPIAATATRSTHLHRLRPRASPSCGNFPTTASARRWPASPCARACGREYRDPATGGSTPSRWRVRRAAAVVARGTADRRPGSVGGTSHPSRTRGGVASSQGGPRGRGDRGV